MVAALVAVWPFPSPTSALLSTAPPCPAFLRQHQNFQALSTTPSPWPCCSRGPCFAHVLLLPLLGLGLGLGLGRVLTSAACQDERKLLVLLGLGAARPQQGQQQLPLLVDGGATQLLASIVVRPRACRSLLSQPEC